MQKSILYAIAFIAFIVLVVSLEWDKIKSKDPKKILIILIILFFLGTAISYFFTY